ncbi:uncharacterized protein [Elaeis guineensis]|uniref:uncharacterized protein n=1 Tax=Elaeis guineensis var. tenera TaxID=51953 RepID=UPI00057B5103
MEAVSRIVRSYWRRRTYQRLEGMSAVSKKGGRAIRLRRRRCRQSKAAPVFVRLRLKVWSPLCLLTWLMDAYVDAVLGLAGVEGRPPALNKGKGGQDGLWGRRIPKARRTSARPGDFERRMAVRIYNSITAASQKS